MWELFINLLGDHTFRVVALGTGFLGLFAGVIGTFAMLKQESLIGDVLSHSALPGIGIAFLLLGEKNLLVMLLGAAISGAVTSFLIDWMKRKSIIKGDGAMALVLSSFFGLGIVIMTYVQRLPNGNQAGLSNFIYGQASAMLTSDVYMYMILGGISLFLLLLFWKEIKLFIFDPVFSHTVGFSGGFLNALLSIMIVMTVVIGLESVGVILMSSLLIAPSVAARQWSNRLYIVTFLAGVFGFLSGVIGSFISSVGVHIPTGPTIVLTASLFVLVSVLFAPERGLVAKQMRYRRSKKQLLAKAKGLTDGEVVTR